MITWVLPIIASVVMFRFLTLPSYGLINIVLVNATEVLPTYIYKQAWNGYVLGYASAGGVLMLVILVVLVLACNSLTRGLAEE